MREFSAQEAQSFIKSLPQLLSHQTHLRVKAFLSGVFSYAVTERVVDLNPFSEVKVGGTTKRDVSKMDTRQRKIHESNNHAYTLEEVAEMLDKLPEPARTVCAVAAFTGLTRSELRGLKWADYDRKAKTVTVRRKVIDTYIGAPKTEARETPVHVLPDLAKILKTYKELFPPVGEGWIFRGERDFKPLNLDNLSRRDIPDYINGAWFGWHAFRRGLGTRLNEAGVDANTIQEILRHSDVSTTMAYYILPDPKRAAAGLEKFGSMMKRKYNGR
jgi:integrase